MSNSFYYFFSATPQVLGGILALFGVFVIFKIQNLKSQMIGIGQSILDNRITIIKSDDLRLSIKVANILIIDKIEKAIRKNDIDGLKTTINLIDDKNYILYRQKFNELLDFHKSLIHRTIILSVFTATIILICLSAIPFGVIILNHTWFLYYLYFIMIDSIFICLFGLIYVLIKSLKEINLK